MRLFIAIDLPQKIKNHLFSLQKKILGAKISWVPKKNLHLTLKFLGDVEDDKLALIKSKLKQIKFEKFTVGLGHIGAFPDLNNVRVIWVGLEPETLISRLQMKVDEQLIEDFPNDNEFKSHLTIGRVKFVSKKENIKKYLTKTDISPIKFEVNKFALVKSTLTRSGPKYEILEEYYLI